MARSVRGRGGRVSSTRSPAQSPYTPLVEIYTNRRGNMAPLLRGQRRNQVSRARVARGRIARAEPDERRAARAPASRSSDSGASRSPSICSTPEAASAGIGRSDQRAEAIPLPEQGQGAAGDVAAADDEQGFHEGILLRTEMTHQVTIRNTGHQFQVQQTVRASSQGALDAGLVLPYGCRDGACGSCKGKLIEGRIDYGALLREGAHAARSSDAGPRSFCQAKPLSDVVIEAREVRKAGDIQVRKLPARVHKLERAADDAMIVYLKLPANERLMFLAGQYIDILLKDGTRRSFSMANAPHDDEFVQLHVRHVPGGAFTEHVFKTMKERDILRFEGPFGTFFLREESDKPIVFVASGTGFAPIKAVIDAALRKGIAAADDALLGRAPSEGPLSRRACRRAGPPSIPASSTFR